MSGQSAREVIARALSWEAPESLNYDMSRWLADDILDALSIRGYSVVRLPERDPDHDRIGYPPAPSYLAGWNDCLDAIERLSGAPDA